MAKFSPFSIAKISAKQLSKAEAIPLNQAQEIFAKSARFSDFHEMLTVSKRSPFDERLVNAAFGVSDLTEVIMEGEVYDAVNDALDECMGGEVADTNAYNFCLSGVEVDSTEYDDHSGLLTINCSLTYSGEQDPDRPYHGTTFYLDAEVRIRWTSEGWVLIEDGFEITGAKNDADLDREAEMDSLYQDWLKEQP